MATFAFKPYTYVPTAPRSKSTATRHKPAPEQVSASLSTLRPAAADGDGGYRPEIRGTGTIYGRSDKTNDDENDGDGDLPTIEELLLAKLQEQGFATEDRAPDKTGGVEEAAADERGGSIDQSRLAQSDNSGRHPDPIVLQGDGDSSASEAEANNNALRAESAAAPGAGLFDSPKTAIDSTTPAPPCSSNRWHNIDNFPETAPRLPLAEQGASILNSTHPYTLFSRLSSEPLLDSISIKGSRYAKSEATTSSSSPPPRHCRASLETQLNQEGRLYIGRGVADEHELINPALDTFPLDKGAREQQEVKQEQEKDKGNSENEDKGPRQEINIVAPAVTAKRAGGSSRPANGRQSLPNLNPSLEPSYNEAGSQSDCDSDDELNSSDSAGDDEKEPRPAKRKQPSSSYGGLARKKRKRPL